MTLFRRPQSSQAQAGYTLMEMLYVVAIFVVLFATPLTLSRGVLDREEFNSLALGLAGWLEAIQRGAQRTTSGCTVTFTTGVNSTAGLSLKPGDTLATVTPSSCSNESSFVIPPFRADATLTARIGTLRTSTLNFTPRGTLVQTSTSSIPTTGPVVIFSLSVANIARCVRITHTSGMITIGSNNNGTTCSSSSFDGSI
jgi:prepilin-type N-terminal cleavage/methylation domain-containing protein